MRHSSLRMQGEGVIAGLVGKLLFNNSTVRYELHCRARVLLAKE